MKLWPEARARFFPDGESAGIRAKTSVGGGAVSLAPESPNPGRVGRPNEVEQSAHIWLAKPLGIASFRLLQLQAPSSNEPTQKAPAKLLHYLFLF